MEIFRSPLLVVSLLVVFIAGLAAEIWPPSAAIAQARSSATKPSSNYPADSRTAPPNAKSIKNNGLGDHYLLLVNTAVASYMTEDKLRQFDKSSYDGIAMAFLHAYDTSAPPSPATMEQQIASWKKITDKDIWPWVYLNRIIGKSATENNEHADTPYFRQIAGADLDDKNGALSELLQVWRNSLTAARDSKVPGIVCDLEFYNYYKEYDIGELARQTGKTPAEVAERLEQIGARMADLAAEAYPDATIWLLFTGLTHAGYKKLDGIPYYPSPTYVSIGLLDEIVKKRYALRVLAGGEGSINYCHDSLDEFRDSIAKRQAVLSSDLEKYHGVLELAGTLALWSDRSAKKDWLSKGSCGASDANTIEDLQSYVELLLKTYRYNWLYATSEGNYLPFSPASAPRFDAVIHNAREQAAATSRRP